MEIIRVSSVMLDTARLAGLRGRTIGLVPTMGALHEGHMGLIRASMQENDLTVASIFVNPAQFGPSEDFEQYPRDVDGDIKMLRAAGVDVLFLPDAPSMYPEGFATRVEVEGLSSKLCGQFRPGHFSGVATVVVKLFNIVKPLRAYFGQKDYQQGLIVRRLAADLNFPLEVVVCPTMREEDGLAMSSRNKYLGAGERKAAGAIFRALEEAARLLGSGGGLDAAKKALNGVLRSEPLISEIQYASVYDPRSLDELSEKEGEAQEALIAVAVRIGRTRLIDNVLV